MDVGDGRLTGPNVNIANMIQKREYAGAIYGLLMEINGGGNGRARPLLTGLFDNQDATVTLPEKVGSVFLLLCTKMVYLLACPACDYW